MKKNGLTVILIFSLSMFFLVPGTGSIYGNKEEKKDQQSEYQKVRSEFAQLYKQKKYGQAATLLEKNFKRFPEKIHAMAWNIAIANIQVKQYKKAVKFLKKALKKGQWYNIYAFKSDFFKPLKQVKGFKEVQKMNNLLKEEAQKKAKPALQVCLPADYSKGKKYPLFIALHGGGENINGFKAHWKSEKLKKEFIVAYIQSSQMVSMTGFAWENLEISKKEISETFAELIKKYPVKKEEIIIGGFSSGGMASMAIVLDNTIPVTGFISLCSAKPENFNKDNILKSLKRGIRGTLITTQMDPRLPDQRKMADLFKESGFQYQFVLTPNIGHWYPQELNKLIDQAISHIRNK